MLWPISRGIKEIFMVTLAHDLVHYFVNESFPFLASITWKEATQHTRTTHKNCTRSVTEGHALHWCYYSWCYSHSSIKSQRQRSHGLSAKITMMIRNVVRACYHKSPAPLEPCNECKYWFPCSLPSQPSVPLLGFWRIKIDVDSFCGVDWELGRDSLSTVLFPLQDWLYWKC